MWRSAMACRTRAFSKLAATRSSAHAAGSRGSGYRPRCAQHRSRVRIAGKRGNRAVWSVCSGWDAFSQVLRVVRDVAPGSVAACGEERRAFEAKVEPSQPEAQRGGDADSAGISRRAFSREKTHVDGASSQRGQLDVFPRRALTRRRRCCVECRKLTGAFRGRFGADRHRLCQAPDPDVFVHCAALAARRLQSPTGPLGTQCADAASASASPPRLGGKERWGATSRQGHWRLPLRAGPSPAMTALGVLGMDSGASEQRTAAAMGPWAPVFSTVGDWRRNCLSVRLRIGKKGRLCGRSVAEVRPVWTLFSFGFGFFSCFLLPYPPLPLSFSLGLVRLGRGSGPRPLDSRLFDAPMHQPACLPR